MLLHGDVSEKMKVLLCRDGPDIILLLLLYMYCRNPVRNQQKIIYPHEAHQVLYVHEHF